MSFTVPPMSRPGVGSMGGGYAGANDMTNNGLSANQNQVSLNNTLILEIKDILLLRKVAYIILSQHSELLITVY